MITTQRQVWLKAAVVGSLWASIEIVIGSFLHNIHMPFAGTIMGFFSLSLLIAFHHKWQDKGLILRAGIIAALMRSLSPSTMIIGPMLGIFIEALFLHGSIRVFGKNKLGYFIGAFAALSSNLIQKIIAMLIFYGFDIVVVLKNMYFYALEQLNFPSVPTSILLSILLGLYGIVALIAVILGTSAGKRALTLADEKINIIFTDKTNSLLTNPKRKQSTWLLLAHLIFIILGLFLLSFAPYFFSLPAVIIYVLIVIYIYPKSFRRFAKPTFWVQLILIVVFAALFFNGFGSEGFFSTKGLLAGLIMSFRAILLITAFTAISFELRNPVVKAVLYKKGFSQLYMALGLAFGALPSLLEHIIRPKVLIKSPVKQIAHMLSFSEHLLHSFQEEIDESQKIIIISGKQQEGKTTFLKEVVKKLKTEGISYDGIIAEGIDVDGKRKGFNLVHLQTGNTELLATTTPHPDSLSYGRYYFDTQVFTKVNSLLKNNQSDMIIIDEVGPMEVQAMGWSPAIEDLLASNKPMIWIVRKSLLGRVSKHWQIPHAQVFDIAKYTPEKVVNAVKKQLNNT